MKTFKDLIKELSKGKTFEEIVSKDTMVECCGNNAYVDQDLEEFLESLGAKITDYGVGYAVIETEDLEIYEIPYEERENRFGGFLENETIVSFDYKTIYNMTEERQ